MASKAAVNGFSAWSNMRLVRGGCETEDVLQAIMKGCTMKVLLEELVGSASTRLDSLDGLTTNQKVTRVDWFVDALKTSGRLPRGMKVDSQMFALHSLDHVLPVLWTLVGQDTARTWSIAPIFQKHVSTQILIAEPLEVGPHKITITASGKPLLFYISASGKSVTQPYKRASKGLNTETMLIDLVNGQLKMTVDGRKLCVKGIQDLVDSQVLCSLVNSMIPGTFTTEVLLSDRWTINLALQAASKIFGVHSLMDAGDLNSVDKQGVCAFLTYFIMAGYQFRQAQAVLDRLEELKQKEEDLERTLVTLTQDKRNKRIEEKLSKTREETDWIQSVYSVESCSSWVQHVTTVQAEVRAAIAWKMKDRFEIITVTRSMTINQLCDLLVVNLSLTGGCGFYSSEGRETLSPDRRLVLHDKHSGEFFEDFSGSENTRGTVREHLKLHPFEVIEVNAGGYTDCEIFFESASRNKMLKAGSKFLYQIFPGTPSQCQRLLLKAARVGEISTLRKLLLFFNNDKSFVNCCDPETGNTALHLASRHGHFEVVILLLESGAKVNTGNNPGCSPFFLATEGLHKNLSNLLIEWGTDIHLKNKVSKTALDLIRNGDLEIFLRRKHRERQELLSKVSAHDSEFLVERLSAHIEGSNTLASLRSRCVRGNTLLHIAAALGSHKAVEMILSQRLDPNILNEKGATPLHSARTTEVIDLLISHGANVNARDCHGNTPLHIMCQNDNTVECVTNMVNSGASLGAENEQGYLAIHCAASQGFVTVIEALLELDQNKVQQSVLDNKQTEDSSSSLLYLASVKDHIDCARWLSEHSFSLKPGEADRLALRILNGPPESCSDPVAMFQYLIQQGANPNAEYNDDNRPLHLSARLSAIPEITGLLMDNGAIVDTHNSFFQTPLFLACQANNPAVAAQLISSGTNYQLKDVYGKCAFDYVNDHEDWMNSGYFTEEINARLKAYSLKHAKELVSSISKVVKVKRIKQ